MKNALKLMRVCRGNGHFDRLHHQWNAQVADLEDSPGEYYPTLLAHAGKIAAENPQDNHYGIFALVREGLDGDFSYEAFVHIDHAKFHKDGPTLRMVWNLLAPKFEASETLEEDIAMVTASFIYEGLKLCAGEMKAGALRIYLHNATDLRYAQGVASAVKIQISELSVSLKGKWLEIALNGWGGEHE